ncbi:sterol O-acyltransferase 2 [Platysternon megacephalum]|uniref:Sterol O-acyltransferase 2 n=1 Tax=Platysternon megacephalum TaxID=55544 RepID=A0A4D9E5J3_9SAUR|nr:sterol O-acyltransferase 2 [Platysternon megacephalum]
MGEDWVGLGPVHTATGSLSRDGGTPVGWGQEVREMGQSLPSLPLGSPLSDLQLPAERQAEEPNLEHHHVDLPLHRPGHPGLPVLPGVVRPDPLPARAEDVLGAGDATLLVLPQLGAPLGAAFPITPGGRSATPRPAGHPSYQELLLPGCMEEWPMSFSAPLATFLLSVAKADRAGPRFLREAGPSVASPGRLWARGHCQWAWLSGETWGGVRSSCHSSHAPASHTGHSCTETALCTVWTGQSNSRGRPVPQPRVQALQLDCLFHPLPWGKRPHKRILHTHKRAWFNRILLHLWIRPGLWHCLTLQNIGCRS